MDLKEEAALRALAYVHDGMVLGLGSGSTATWFVELLGERLRAGTLRDIVAVPTSQETARHATALGIPLSTLDEHKRLDLDVDGADEVDPDLNLIKGLGRALLREKILVVHADRFVVIVDESKMVMRLGTHVPLPVEILPFGVQSHLRWLNGLGCRAELECEPDGSPAVTDNGNYIAHCRFPDGIADAYALARTLADRPGIVEHGLFLGMTRYAVVAGRKGVRVYEAGPTWPADPRPRQS